MATPNKPVTTCDKQSKTKQRYVGGRLFRYCSKPAEFIWVQWVRGKRSTLTDTNYGSIAITEGHPKYERIAAVYDLLVDKENHPFHIDLTQDEWEQLYEQPSQPNHQDHPVGQVP